MFNCAHARSRVRERVEMVGDWNKSGFRLRYPMDMMKAGSYMSDALWELISNFGSR